MRICFVKNKLNKLRIGLKHKLARNKNFIANRYATVGGSKHLCSFDIRSKVPNPSSFQPCRVAEKECSMGNCAALTIRTGD